jgi:serine/threonine-protein kinase RsbW/stage II sporulation protein AB (anti-sigma F factor)
MDDRSAYHRYSGSFPAVPLGAKVVREEVASIAAECGMSGLAVGHVKLAVSEAVTNAVMHAYVDRDEPGHIRVDVFYEQGEILVVIGDDGSGPRPRPDTAGAGLGFPMIATVAKRMEVLADAGTEVRMVFDCPKGIRRPA